MSTPTSEGLIMLSPSVPGTTTTTASTGSGNTNVALSLNRRRNLPDLLIALPSQGGSTRPNIPRTDAIQIPGSSSLSSSAFPGRRASVSYSDSEAESVGQQLRSIGDDLDRILNSGGSPALSPSSNWFFFGRSRSQSMGFRRSSTSSLF